MLQIVTNCNNKMDKRGRIILSIAIISAILISIFYLCLVIANPENNWIIEDNKVYVDNNNIRISAAPHTLHESSYVYFNIISKVYEGNADLILGFDTPLVSPTKAELYKPELKTITNSYTCNSNFNYTTEPKHAWCYIQNNQTQELELIYEHDFETLDLEKKTIYWEKSYLQEWKDYTNTLTSTSYNFEGINEWHYIKNIPIQKNKEYLFRSLINIPRKSRFSPMPVDIKYWAAIKPSGETLQQAISNNHLYYLDPWVNSSGQDQDKGYLTTGLNIYYKIDEASGTTTEELIRSKNLTGLGGSRQTGLINKSYLENNEVRDSGYTLNSISNSDSEFSICSWHYRTGNLGVNNRIIGNDDSGGVSSNGEFAILASGDNNGNIINIALYDGAGLRQITPTTLLPINTWTMVCFTFDGTTSTLYYNTTSIGTVGAGSFDSSGEATNLHFFGRSEGSSYVSNLYYDEVGMWNRSLNTTEISDLYNNGAGITYEVIIDTTDPNVTIPEITPTSPTTNNNLNCNATLTDTQQTNLTANWTWYKNTILNLSGTTTEIQNGTNTLITTLSSGNTSKGENWTCGIIPYDEYNYGNQKNSTDAIILNAPPSIPIQLEPENGTGSAIYSTITFIWDNSTDADTDNPTITYDLEIYNESNMQTANLIYNKTNITEGSQNTSIAINLSDFTTKDDDYYWRVRANDSEDVSDWSPNWTFQYANWTITFNATDSVTGEQIVENTMEISCDNGFSVTDKNPYTAEDTFSPGTWTCTFSGFPDYYSKEQSFTADDDKVVNVTMSEKTYLTQEEHTWLEALYNCIIGQDCSLYNLLLEINSTVGNIWEHTKPTDESVVTLEDITNRVVNTTSNLTIDYNISIPIKAGYASGTYLPVRIGFWFLNESNTTCYSQGDKPTGVEESYCQPLIAETIGPMGGSVSFTVKLWPSLPAGNYSIKRIIDIDPNNIWINYGQEVVGTFMVTESIANPDINLEKTGEAMPSTSNNQQSSSDDSTSSSDSSSSRTIIREKEIIKLIPQDETRDKDNEDKDKETIKLGKPGITGGVIGANLLSGGSLIFIIIILCATFVIFLIITSRTILKIKSFSKT